MARNINRYSLWLSPLAERPSFKITPRYTGWDYFSAALRKPPDGRWRGESIKDNRDSLRASLCASSGRYKFSNYTGVPLVSFLRASALSILNPSHKKMKRLRLVS